VTPLGIEPATFQLVAQYLNQVRHRVPRFRSIGCPETSVRNYHSLRKVSKEYRSQYCRRQMVKRAKFGNLQSNAVSVAAKHWTDKRGLSHYTPTPNRFIIIFDNRGFCGSVIGLLFTLCLRLVTTFQFFSLNTHGLERRLGPG
jgi:hypothetical protein